MFTTNTHLNCCPQIAQQLRTVDIRLFIPFRMSLRTRLKVIMSVLGTKDAKAVKTDKQQPTPRHRNRTPSGKKTVTGVQEDSKLQAEVVAKDTQPQQKDGQLEERDSQIRHDTDSLQEQQQQQQLQQQLQQLSICAACSEKENSLQKLEEAHHQLQVEHQKCQDVIRSHEKTIQDLNWQLCSGQCQQQECVKPCRKKRQAAIKQMGDPGKDLDKQRVVEHDQLIQEFEELTTDTDGLLGGLEGALDEYGGGASFEAKKLLCVLFQVQTK